MKKKIDNAKRANAKRKGEKKMQNAQKKAFREVKYAYNKQNV